ncbi:MAG: response regulator [Candidatus Desulfofervidaceae bacterium]|nr:response regulator [Candidatus Desulfofervidaceae bacterium]MDL1969626.1 response regulator [Candidatus Desulfofervidaceae bacterium]
MKVLVVEDELALRRVLVEFMRLCGWKVDHAGNAFEALRILKDGHYDVVITDGIMPQMTGPKFTQIIKRRYPEIYVIALTGSDLRKEFTAAGANVYLQKPIDLKLLQNTVESCFKRDNRSRRQG